MARECEQKSLHNDLGVVECEPCIRAVKSEVYGCSKPAHSVNSLMIYFCSISMLYPSIL